MPSWTGRYLRGEAVEDTVKATRRRDAPREQANRRVAAYQWSLSRIPWVRIWVRFRCGEHLGGRLEISQKVKGLNGGVCAKSPRLKSFFSAGTFLSFPQFVLISDKSLFVFVANLQEICKRETESWSFQI